MNTQTETNQFTQKELTQSEDKYYAEAKRRLELLRIMGLLDGPINVSVEDVQEWCRERDNDPVCAQLDSMACRKVFDLEHQ